MRSSNALVALVALAALAAPPARGEDRLDEDLQLWGVFSATFVLPAGPIELVPYLEVQPRFDDDAGDFDQVQNRAALLVRPGGGFSLGVGFMYAAILENDYTAEYRPYQEVAWSRDLIEDGLALRLRIREEQRMFDGEDPVRHRFRFRAGFELPLTDLGDLALGLEVWNEVFINWNDTEAAREGLGENRSYAGLSLELASGIEVEAGYMAQLRNRWGEPDALGHTILLGIALTFE